MGENRFLLIEFPIWGSLENSCSEPFFLARRRTFLAPKKIVSQSHAQKFPIIAYMSFWSLNQPCKQASILSALHTIGFQSHPLVAAHLAAAVPLSLRAWLRCQITPGGRAGGAPFTGNFPAQASMSTPILHALLSGQESGSPGAMCHVALGVASQGLAPGEVHIPVCDLPPGSSF